MPSDTAPIPPYRLTLPTGRACGLVVASPHSGSDYPPQMLALSRLDRLTLRSSEDAFVEHLLQAAPTLGAPLIAARLPRAYVDLNRGSDELDPALIEGLRGQRLNPRVAAGLGVIPRVVAAGRAIYAGKISRAEAQARIDTVWRPYHARLATLMAETYAAQGVAILLDVHSMPHEVMASQTGRVPQIVLGDRFGGSAAPAVVAAIEAAFAAEGLRAARNTPFAGAYIAQAYGRPRFGRHVVQVEIDRALYMDESRIEPSADFDAFAALMARVLARIAPLGGADALQLAAE
ncbi:N-formylglutamate amidohydrolase [Phaeovulum sp.]|uniref:N-formylglutamate amidohydrolase n=1 Tax=Phaeovulum sp. TaxID=2934796 RepID=UPI0035201FC4